MKQGLLSTPIMRRVVSTSIVCDKLTIKCETRSTDKQATTIVGGSSKIQTLCHMTQVPLKLRFTAMERFSNNRIIIILLFEC